MFQKKKRVDKKLFQSIMKEGKAVSSPFFVFKYIHLHQKVVQLACVAPKALAKRAVARNKLRRRGYALLRFHNPLSGAGILFYRKSAVTASYQDLKNDLGVLLKKARCL